ncbi:hypothetical protein AWB65_06631 [Caballeronia humi]|jgi:hypothetical protein|uniref:Uncharacterized protein n=1 Tax=Caballeronia humi TaxID=326474 RepID=A0A158JGQ1_9BURK|nr:hypothetical protein AWB65_06631 [Caballeronia humi]
MPRATRVAEDPQRLTHSHPRILKCVTLRQKVCSVPHVLTVADESGVILNPISNLKSASF